MRSPDLPEEVLRLDGLMVRYRRAIGCEDVSLRVPFGAVYGLLGRSGAGKSTILRCILGREKPVGGSATVCGWDAWRDRRRVRPLLESLPAGARPEPGRLCGVRTRLLLLDEPDLGTDPHDRSAIRGALRDASARGVAILLSTRNAGNVEGLADRIGILRAGRLPFEGEAAALIARFRRLRYRNEVTPTRTEFGTELDLFDAVRVRVRGWGVEAVVSNFSDELFERLRVTDGVIDPETAPMTLEEIFDAVAPEPPVHGQGTRITR